MNGETAVRSDAAGTALPDDLRTIIEGIAAGVTVQDESGRLLFVNADAARLSGFATPDEMMAATPGEIVGRFQLIDEDGQPFDPSLLPGRQVLAGQQAGAVTVGFRLASDESEHWSMLHARGATLADGRRVAINTFHDITPRIETERRIRESERQTRAVAEERRRAEELAHLLADTTLRLDEARDPATVVAAAAEAAIPGLADWCLVDLLEPDGSLRHAALAARDEDVRRRIEPLRDHRLVVPPDRTGPGVDREGQTIVIPDLAEHLTRIARPGPDVDTGFDSGAGSDIRTILETSGVRSAIAQPLVARGETIGTVVFGTVGDRELDGDAATATAALATRLGLAIANARSYDAEQRARRAAEDLAERMERLQAVTRVLAEATTVDEVITITADEVARAFGAQRVAIGLLDEQFEQLQVIVLPYDTTGRAGSAAAGEPVAIPLSADIPIAVAARVLAAVRVDGERASGFDEADSTGWAIPLAADQSPLGALWIGFGERAPSVPVDERLARAYADLAAGAIVRLRLGLLRQELLAANEAERLRLETVLRRMPLGVILVAVPDGRVLYANEAANRIRPLLVDTDGDLENGRIRGYRTDGGQIDAGDWPLRRAMLGETVDNEIVEIVQDDGTHRTFGLSAAPIPGPSGTIEAAIITSTDLSDRVRAQEREQFLARATEVLASSLDYETTVQTVADLAVPVIADWCVVQLASEEGLPRRIAVAHRDPAKVALAIQMEQDYPQDPDAPNGSAAVLRTGRTEYVPDIPPELIEAAARDERHLALLRSLDLRSYISVPLIATGRIVGVLSLVASESDRRFEPADVTFAEALAARAAAAIENARLFRDGVRFTRLLDATGDAVLMLQPGTGRISYANRGAAEQLGRAVDDLVGTAIANHLDEDGAAALHEAMSALAASGGPAARTVTVAFRRATGGTIPVEVRLEFVALDGAPAGILAIARDISDRIAAQERLRSLAMAEHARAAELNAVIRALGDGVIVCDRDGRVILANPAARAIVPASGEATYADVLDALDDEDGVAPALGGRGGPVELRVRGADERWVELTTWPVGSDHRDEPSDGHDETIVLLRDVTDQRQRQAVRDTFIGVLSHELRTPVTTIYAGAKVLARPGDLPEETRREIFGDMAGEAERLHRLVEDVVAMTRFGDEGGDVGTEPVLLQRVLPSVVASEEARWPGVVFETSLGTGLSAVVADPTYVEQIVRNLLSNAAKYGGPGTRVVARVEPAGDEVQVRILDDGPGFPIEEAEQLFELFFRSERTARSAAGAGIGLFVCARLVRAMGGRIWAANRPEGGAEFGFSLRVMPEEG